MIKAVIFDLDDTLFPEIEYVKTGFKCVEDKISKMYDIEVNSGFLLDLYAIDKSNVYNKALDILNLKYNASVIQELVDTYREHIPIGIQLYHDVEKTLEHIKILGLKLGIITDGRPIGQRNKISQLDISEIFDSIIITDELGGEKFRKPHELPFILMADDLQINIDEMMYIGDNPSKDFAIKEKFDITTVQILRNGIYSDMKYTKNIKPDYVINSLEELFIKKIIT